MMNKAGKTFLGIELGSTRIKAVLIDERYATIASGSFGWENRLENGYWTYHLDEVWLGLQASFKQLAEAFETKYGEPLSLIDGMGVSAMMHGYLPFDKNGRQLVAFRTWRNTATEKAADILTEKFGFNIPQRWSIAHLYQAILNGEDHVGDIAFLTTLAGYVHYKLTGENVMGVGEASGMFPIDSTKNSYNARMMEAFESLVAGKSIGWKLRNILPKILCAGEHAGILTEEGARLLDPAGTLKAGIPLCPPEGDAGTGMVATNSVAERTGNISAGTSVFAMLVLEKELSQLYTEIDMVTTPSGKPVAMVHCNNCTSDLDAWIRLLGETATLMGVQADKPVLYETLYKAALEGDADGGGLFACNYLSGEHLTGFEQGRPLVARTPESKFTLSNFIRTLLFSSMATLKLGMETLTEKENVKLEQLVGHGGWFKTKGVGQNFMASALNVPVTVMEYAGEGGAWGIALLSAYMAHGEGSLEGFLVDEVFANSSGIRVEPDKRDLQGFTEFMKRYKAGLAIERAAVENLK